MVRDMNKPLNVPAIDWDEVYAYVPKVVSTIIGRDPEDDDEPADVSDHTGERACNDFMSWARNH